MSSTTPILLTAEEFLEYLQAGVGSVCVVDAESKSVRLYFANGRIVRLQGADLLHLPPPLEELAVAVAQLFA